MPLFDEGIRGDLLPDPLSNTCGRCGRDSWFGLRAAVWSGVWDLGLTDARPLVAAIYNCPGCGQGSLFLFQTFMTLGEHHASLLEQAPTARAIELEGLPPEIQADRLEAINSYLNGQYKAAVLMGRSALQRAVRILDPTRSSLNAELDNLADQGIITRQLRANADEVRLLGNDAAHPEELGSVTEDDAKDAIVFLNDFLQTTIVIPARQQARASARGINNIGEAGE